MFCCVGLTVFIETTSAPYSASISIPMECLSIHMLPIELAKNFQLIFIQKLPFAFLANYKHYPDAFRSSVSFLPLLDEAIFLYETSQLAAQHPLSVNLELFEHEYQLRTTQHINQGAAFSFDISDFTSSEKTLSKSLPGSLFSSSTEETKTGIIPHLLPTQPGK